MTLTHSESTGGLYTAPHDLPDSVGSYYVSVDFAIFTICYCVLASLPSRWRILICSRTVLIMNSMHLTLWLQTIITNSSHQISLHYTTNTISRMELTLNLHLSTISTIGWIWSTQSTNLHFTKQCFITVHGLLTMNAWRYAFQKRRWTCLHGSMDIKVKLS